LLTRLLMGVAGRLSTRKKNAPGDAGQLRESLGSGVGG
jgi:hypothetical protein